MSEIPFVNALGDAIERSAAAHIAGRRRRIRRRLTGGVLGFALLATGVAAASGVFTSAPPDQLATTSIGCYSRADLEHTSVTVLGVNASDPVGACRKALAVGGPMVACAGPQVMVFPGGPRTCATLGLRPLPPEYGAAHAKVLRLQRRIAAIEAANDCWGPEALAARVQTLLGRMPAWRGYRVQVDRAMPVGPCGSVTHPDGFGGRSIDGVVDTQKRQVIVTVSAARSTLELLDHLGDLPVASTARCYDRAGAEALARGRLAASGRTVTFRIEHLDGGSVKAFQDRIDQGCSVIPGFGAADDGYGIVVTIRE
jgi:hypothetical protein